MIKLSKLIKKLGYTLFVLLALIFFGFIIKNNTNAQVSSSGIAIDVPLSDSDAVDGDIICSYTDGNRRCETEYDPSMYGVISDNPAVAVEDTELDDARLVVNSGVVTVRVSSVNGDISEGNFVSSSTIPGVAMLAARNGYVLGASLENYESDNPQAIGKIQVLVNIHPAAGLAGPQRNLLNFIRQGLAVPLFEPLESLRYLLAVAIVLISFTLGMIYFGRASRAGIEAIGRNPLAKRVIQLTVFLNISLTIVIILTGLGIAYLILIL
ncbi:MAG: hypothetical protein US60_C0013G0002 [Microgenomates group bacterium GW2011_GWC1_37_8]|uniref:Uncharacterized protein n=2 Tax=Candidatus Woeseibacteriota TaxID=1752722 RepID=A0A0G0NEJ1_9BACT|nr:MAG: hypothetical protein US60_C0013G0002 [Microgenomates group bacterium GW2011_GWC1_37_8]KKQ84314.1 MAG: hypothetical protein UT08_C0019G0008 [Candidatus Woesebacteria bacterium GW2011_GWB1_38_8]OGM21361.1 MAG: hypothetical protein A2863_03130 [Candidatus Woesebacteria bacterium RIFCSPHIGHO2_01_FULL_38_9b]